MEDFGEDLEVEDLATTEEEDLVGVEAVADLEAAVSPLGMGFVEDVEDLETTAVVEDMEEVEDMETMEEDMETTAAVAEAMEGEDTAVEDIRSYNLYIFV